MDWKFSAATGGFYPADSLDEYPSLPGDLVDVSTEQYQALQLAQSRDGLRIGAGANGFPAALEKLPPTLEELKQTRDVLLQLATLRVAPLQDAVDLGIATPEEESALHSWKQYRVTLNRLDLTSSTITWPAPPA